MSSIAAAVLLVAIPADALVFASPDTEPPREIPEDFPYWGHVTQRRYEGPTVIYLGAGYALTARHVGVGEILLDGKVVEPVLGTKHTVLNENGKAADAMVFGLERSEELPGWPLIPIATSPPRIGEEVLLIGFGRERARVVEFDVDGHSHYSFAWSGKGSKRWATNRISSVSETLVQMNLTTHAFSMIFDPPNTPGATPYEAQAAVGDSGGGVFVKRAGEWQLAGLMVSVAGDSRAPSLSSAYGDRTYVADLSHYREEVLRWTRAACSNERDDDGDELIDYPDDPGCDGPQDQDEREPGPAALLSLLAAGAAFLGIPLVLFLAWRRLRHE